MSTLGTVHMYLYIMYVAAVGIPMCCGDCLAVGWYFYVVFRVVFVHL